MIGAFVMIYLADATNPSEIASLITPLPEVDNLHIVYGDCNLVIFVKVNDMNKLRDFSLNKLLKIPGISKTKTLILAEDEQSF